MKRKNKDIKSYISVSRTVCHNFLIFQIFGPVQSILKFDTFEEVIDRANDTNYGLAAGVITNDITTALSFAKLVRAGSVW